MPQAGAATYFKLIGAMFMWGGTWIAGRVIAQELSAPLAVAALRFVLSGLAVGGFMLLSEGRLPFPESGRDWGLIWGVCEDGELHTEACALASRMAAGPLQAYWRIRQALDRSSANDLAAQLDLERDSIGALGRSDDYREGVDAFKARRPPRFVGR